MLSFTDACSQWILYSKPCDTDLHYCKRMGKVWSHLNITEITPDRWVNFRISELSNSSDATANRCRDTLQTVFNFIGNKYDLKFPKLPKYKVYNERVRFLTIKEAHKLLDAYDDVVKPLFHCLAYNGVRKTEASKYTWSMYKDNYILVPKEITKTFPRRMPVHSKLQALLKPNGSDYLFPHPSGRKWKSWSGGSTEFDRYHRKALKKVGIKDFTIHDWRHHFASHIMMNGGNLKVLMQLGGWSSTRSVMRYAGVGDTHILHTLESLK